MGQRKKHDRHLSGLAIRSDEISENAKDVRGVRLLSNDQWVQVQVRARTLHKGRSTSRRRHKHGHRQRDTGEGELLQVHQRTSSGARLFFSSTTAYCDRIVFVLRSVVAMSSLRRHVSFGEVAQRS